jgi:putative ATP-binding cassette transporter
MVADQPPSQAPAETASQIEDAAQSGLVPQVRMMLIALWTSPVRPQLFGLVGAIFAVVAATAYGQIRLNRWNKPFYDALSRHDFEEFIVQLGVFCLIAGTLLVLNVAQKWLGETLKVKLREGLVHDLVQAWLTPGRAFQLASAGPIGVNPDQRMHEDARHLTELSTDLGIGLLQSSILLVTFIAVLWRLSQGFALPLAGHRLVIPGYMVWAAVFYAVSASLLSYWIGRSLIARNSERYAREAELRFSLVRVNEHIDAISLAGGEADEARRIERELASVLQASQRIVTGATNLTWITAGYGWFTLVAPILVAAPLYFAGHISFGGLMMAAGAFTQVQSSLRWFVDNFGTIADWRATLLRVASFRRAVLATDERHDKESRIALESGAAGAFQIDHLQISSPAGCTQLVEPEAKVAGGERVAFVGEAGTGKTLLFRALAGLWPWGSGRIVRPTAEAVHYMPRSPYLPPGTLREVLAYPSKVDSFQSRAFGAALERLGRKGLVPLLDHARNWTQELSEDEQHCVAFARALLHAPAWLVIDEVLDSLAPDILARVREVLTEDLGKSGVLYIGRAETHPRLFARALHLVKDQSGRKLTRSKLAHSSHPPLARALGATS